MTKLKCPSKDEIAAAALLLRQHAHQKRQLAAGQRELAANARTPQIAKDSEKLARRLGAEAAGMEKVATWMVQTVAAA